jgi:hypothetical protein
MAYYWLTPPSRAAFFISVLLAVLALLVRYAHIAIPVVSHYTFETLLVAFLLLLATCSRASSKATAAEATWFVVPRRCLNLKGYIPLEHFFAVASHFMPAFSQAACVLGAPAKAGAATATTRLKATIESRVLMGFLRRRCI